MIASLNPKVIFEIGVGNPSICRTREWMGSGIRLELFEAHPSTYSSLVGSYGGHSNVTIHNVALYDREGEIEFFDHGDSSWVSEVLSPLANNPPSPEYVPGLKRLKVPCRPLSFYDKGDIDVALIDTEGCEWRVISTMISRPKLIVLEAKAINGGTYVTPNWDQLEAWLRDNRYDLHHTDLEDWWFLRRDAS